MKSKKRRPIYCCTQCGKDTTSRSKICQNCAPSDAHVVKTHDFLNELFTEENDRDSQIIDEVYNVLKNIME
jgi:hypothetical protein